MSEKFRTVCSSYSRGVCVRYVQTKQGMRRRGKIRDFVVQHSTQIANDCSVSITAHFKVGSMLHKRPGERG